MNKIKALFLAIFLSFFALYSNVSATTNTIENNRYLVQTNKGFWKNTLNARNVFEDGFTADLSDWQLRVAKLAGLKLTSVKRFTILPATPSPKSKLRSAP